MSEAELYTADVLETWLRHGLQHGPRSVRGDWQQRHATRQAAVLVGIVPRAEPMLLLTRRAEHLPKHPGQIAFPGGAVDATDANAIATALREAGEEVGLDAALVRPLGLLPPYITITQFNVTPVLALLDPQYRARACPDEVAEVFELPLLELLDTGRYEWRRVERNGRAGQSLFIECAGRTVWGATAGMLVQLAVLLGREDVVLPDQALQQGN